jgi:L-asparagine transporter-like permease
MQGEEKVNQEHGLLHQLTAGQMAMVAVGGSIGTGLLLGSAAAMGIAGPGVIVSFLIATFIAWTVTLAMGEMACVHPAAGSFGLYAELYLNPWAGFVSRYGYWAAIAFAVGAELVASATYMAFWFPRVPAMVWIAMFAAVLLAINLRSVGAVGRFEYWFAMVKVVTITAFILAGGFLLLSGHVPAQYTAQGGFFPMGRWAPLLATSFALYTFAGIEMVVVSTGESRSVAEIPRAVRITFALLAFVYLGAMVVLVGVMPWNRAGVTESPFVSVFRHVNLPGVSHLMNFVVLTAALSGANAALYVDSRMLFSLARGGYAPPRLGRLNAAGSPVLALLVSSFGIVVALAMEKWVPQDAFVYIIEAALFGAMLSWLVSLAAHVSFRRQLPAQRLAELPLRSPGGAGLSALGLAGLVIAIAATWWVSPTTVVSSAVYLALLTLAYFLMKKTGAKSTMAK